MHKGWGSILLDTALTNTPPASTAVVKVSGGAVISEMNWLKNADGYFYGVGFTFDKTSNNSTTRAKALTFFHGVIHANFAR